jgi:hypothetical protein
VCSSFELSVTRLVQWRVRRRPGCSHSDRDDTLRYCSATIIMDIPIRNYWENIPFLVSEHMFPGQRVLCIVGTICILVFLNTNTGHVWRMWTFCFLYAHQIRTCTYRRVSLEIYYEAELQTICTCLHILLHVTNAHAPSPLYSHAVLHWYCLSTSYTVSRLPLPSIF